jgi:hypothetical protein
MRACFALGEGAGAMNWTSPAFEEIKMDAEIGSYQEDSEPRESPLAAGGSSAIQVEEATRRAE